MTQQGRVSIGWPAIIAAALALPAAGAAIAWVALGRPAASARRDAGAPAAQAAADPHAAHAAPAPAAGDAEADVTVTLDAAAAERAGITVGTVGLAARQASVRVPGVVEPNAYRQVAVTPLVAGRVTRVAADLGARVRRGQTLAEIFSPELADAHTRYRSARAALDAHARELGRTEQLAGLGAASRQEVERAHADHTAMTAEVDSARARLELLGVPAQAIEAGAAGAAAATAVVPAPIDGIVTERLANVGLNVDSATPLFTVVDLSTVWVVADLFEKDFARVRVGSRAEVATSAYPDLRLDGRVSYIDPRVSAETRTARLRVEVPNGRGDLRLGMYADVAVRDSRAGEVPVLPRSAVQAIGGRQVVYLPHTGMPGMFTERVVRLGDAIGDVVEVVSGVNAGDTIVTAGTFFIRAERERMGTAPR